MACKPISTLVLTAMTPISTVRPTCTAALSSRTSSSGFALGPFQPYLGGGVGGYYAEADDVEVRVNGRTRHAWRREQFRLRLAAHRGADYYWNERMSTFLEYKFPQLRGRHRRAGPPEPAPCRAWHALALLGKSVDQRPAGRQACAAFCVRSRGIVAPHARCGAAKMGRHCLPQNLSHVLPCRRARALLH
jgi:hypothetical protein